MTDAESKTDAKLARIDALLKPLIAYTNNFCDDHDSQLVQLIDYFSNELSENPRKWRGTTLDSILPKSMDFLSDLSAAMLLVEQFVGQEKAFELLHQQTWSVTFMPYVLERLPARLIRALLEFNKDDILNERRGN